MLEYQEIPPTKELQEYVRCYFTVRIEGSFAFSDIKYPSGQVEIAFNLGKSAWRSEVDKKGQTDPKIELLGQMTRPLLIQSPGETLMLGIRFYSCTAGYFFDPPLEEFNNKILDLGSVMGRGIRSLHEQLLNEPDMAERVKLVETFLLKRLAQTSGDKRLALLKRITRDLTDHPQKSIKAIAGDYNISTRNMQRLFLRHVGITPKLYGRINRFNQCLQYIGEGEELLTRIAYKSGYADQSHFIKDFRAFADTTPSVYDFPLLPSR